MRVVADDLEQPLIGERKVLIRQASGFARALHQETLRNFELFLLRVARQTQNLHAILQGLRDGVQDVGGADEHHFRKVVFDVQIVVRKRVVQLGIEHFHERGRRVAAEIHGHFVDFVENEDRIHRAGLFHHLDDLAGQRADVSAAVAANFRFVTHAAQGNADELAPRGMADGHRQRSLADARGPDKTENRALGIFHKLADGQEFQDALLDFLQAVMLVIENLFGGTDVADFLGSLLPRHRQQPIEIIAAHGRFGGHRRHQFEPLELLDGFFAYFLAHSGGVDFFLELVNLVLFAAAEFLLNGFQLFIQVILFLRALHLTLHAGVDVAVDVELLKLDFEDVGDAVQPLNGVDGLEQVLLFIHGELQIRRDGVREAPRIIHAGSGDHGVVIQALRKLDELLVQGGNFLHGLIDLGRRLDARRQQAKGGAEKSFLRGDRHGPGAFHALDQYFDIAVRELDALHDVRERTNRIDLFRLGVIHRGVVLRRKENFLVAGERFLQRADTGFAADDEGGHLLRKNDHIAHRHHRNAP